MALSNSQYDAIMRVYNQRQFQDKLAGAIVHDEEVVVDGNITTSYGLGGAIPFALELVRQLAGPAEADRIQKAIAYRH